MNVVMRIDPLKSNFRRAAGFQNGHSGHAGNPFSSRHTQFRPEYDIRIGTG
jgi:hypothetical protein